MARERERTLRWKVTSKLKLSTMAKRMMPSVEDDIEVTRSEGGV